jgi:hypothetical protein
MVNSHMIDKIFQQKAIAQLFPQGKLPELCNHGKEINKEDMIGKIQIIMEQNQDKPYYQAAKRDLQYYGRQGLTNHSCEQGKKQSPTGNFAPKAAVKRGKNARNHM